MSLDPMDVSLLSALLIDFRGPDAAYPRLAADAVPAARSLLARLISDADALEDYLEFIGPALDGASPPAELDYERACLDVAEGGADAIGVDALAVLLLDPVGVVNVRLARPADSQGAPSARPRQLV